MAWTTMTHGRDGDFVIRVEPWNRPQTSSQMTNVVSSLARLQRVMGRNHSWILRVRRSTDDPFGPVIHEEGIHGRAAVPEAIERVELAIRNGTLNT